MSYWNIRIIYHDKEDWFGVHEIFYNNDNSVYAYTEDPIEITGESVKDIIEYLDMIKRDITSNPALIESKIKLVNWNDNQN